jgi:phosphatidylserine/phosphatidylglycerophosphate/cardiolipin synthase-like enzyme
LAVADGKTLLISSANLTEHAMTLNMEMGILVSGGEWPGRVVQHFQQLIADGKLVSLTRVDDGSTDPRHKSGS